MVSITHVAYVSESIKDYCYKVIVQFRVHVKYNFRVLKNIFWIRIYLGIYVHFGLLKTCIL